MKPRFYFSFLTLALLVTCLSFSPVKAEKHTYAIAALKDTSKDAKAIVSDYINAIGGLDAVKKMNSISSSGNLLVQGMSLDVSRKQMVPNKSMQTVTMSGNTVGKTVFNGTKGYQEQMGSRTDMSEDDMADLKSQTSLIEEADYLNNPAIKLSTAGTDSVNGSKAYKVLVTMPSGKSDTEYYDVATKLLLKKVAGRNINGQSVETSTAFSDYKKVGGVLLPYKIDAGITSGAVNQSFQIVLTDVKINEGVSDSDFE